MCTPINIRKAVFILSVFKCIQLGYDLLFGLLLILNVNDFHEGFGKARIVAVGAGYFTIAMLSSFHIWLGIQASYYHNKFLLLVHLTLEAFLLSSQFILGATLIDFGTPVFSADIREACSHTNFFDSINTTVQDQEDAISLEACELYWKSKQTLQLSHLWKVYFLKATINNQTNYLKKIVDFQDKQNCCGFYPPYQCGYVTQKSIIIQNTTTSDYYDNVLSLEDDNIFKEWHDCAIVLNSEDQDTSSYLNLNYWYPRSNFTDNNEAICYSSAEVMTSSDDNDYDDNPSIFLGNGSDTSCGFHLPLGSCSMQQKNVDFFHDISSSRKGCVGSLEDKMNNLLLIPSRIALALCALNILHIFYTCVFFWKRKQRDILPSLQRLREIERRKQNMLI